MIPTGAMLKEYRRLVAEAAEVAYSHDEYLKLIFSAAMRLADGSWKVPQITNCVVERIEENQRSGCELGTSGTFEKVGML